MKTKVNFMILWSYLVVDMLILFDLLSYIYVWLSIKLCLSYFYLVCLLNYCLVLLKLVTLRLKA